MRRIKAIITVLLFLIFWSSIALAPAYQSTTMTWFVPASKSHLITYGGTCSAIAFFFPEPKAALDSDTDGNAMKILPYNDRDGTTACQAAGTAGMIITNNGSATVNIDANFFAALDMNIWLKVWQGIGTSDANTCGAGGLGGWKLTCGITSTSTAVNRFACKDFNLSNGVTGSRLITGLLANDTNHLCFSGEMMDGNGEYMTLAGPQVPAAVSNADHNGVFWTGAT